MPPSYEQDFYAWTQYTARALAEGRVSEVDLKHLAEEVEDMGKRERRELTSYLTRALLHMLKIRYQPEKHTRSWDDSVGNSQKRIRRRLAESPSLKPALSELLDEAYDDARDTASQQTGLALDVFPAECPFSVEEVLGESA